MIMIKTTEEARLMWIDICKMFENTRNYSPSKTIDKIINKYGKNRTLEMFSIVSKLLKNDGRIYSENIDYFKFVPIDVDADSVRFTYYGGCNSLDYIHPAHINQMMTELRRRYKITYPRHLI